MRTGKDLKTWAKEQRIAGVEFTTRGELRFHIYHAKRPGDEVQLNIRRSLPGEEPDIKFEEHPDTKQFWVFALPKAGAAAYEHSHEELSMNDPIEKLKKLFPDGRFDYIVDNLLALDDD